MRFHFSSLFLVLALLAGGGVVHLSSIAQAQNDDESYDPFADYSEFDEDSDEEADIQFFRHGRFVTLGLAVGYRGFTGNLHSLYGNGPTFGLYMTYFFDLRWAMQFGFLTGDYSFGLNQYGDNVTGNVSLMFLNLDLKYYLNTQNFTRSLADLSPYFFGGLAQVNRSYSIAEDPNATRSSTIGLNAGAGIEIPISRKKSFFALQASYRYYTFKDSNTYVFLPNANMDSTVKPSGNSYDLLGILGLSF